MNIAIISGSARPARQSHQVAQYAQQQLNKLAVSNWIWDIKESNLPLLTAVFAEQENPDYVLQDLHLKLLATDAFLIVSPEHNASYPGSLKNSMDYFFKEYSGKIFGLVGVSSGVLGGINAIKNLQQYSLKLNGIVCPQFLLTPSVQKTFNDGSLVDPGYAERMDKFLNSFLSLVKGR
ncbi:NADPH-dependent FMN reductase [Pedobacter nutrimenti]|jgi:NAD(P)H-dependent FMN reductase|uniref:NAD(P)H-dependent FMN reductase n=1 Tax=Pedobacter nutrimenti TaxID=1241337 RepID=A0A318UJS9_9SPHI|nr:NAD(P)H-dependent oxidoreductase [Pedobacter nutrimenti]PYF74215.1 NAD(P)H-dependent FMN reductase [Pedobacter nutrimenti]|eukprot:gene11167-13007_t